MSNTKLSKLFIYNNNNINNYNSILPDSVISLNVLVVSSVLGPSPISLVAQI